MSEKTYDSIITAVTGDIVARGIAVKVIGFALSTTSGVGSATIRTGGVGGTIKGNARNLASTPGDVMFPQPVIFEDGIHVSAISGTGGSLIIYYRIVKGA